MQNYNDSKGRYRVLQITSKWKTLEQLVYFLKAIEFWPTFKIIFLYLDWIRIFTP